MQTAKEQAYYNKNDYERVRLYHQEWVNKALTKNHL